MRYRTFTTRGFTLVEILLVMALMAILVSIVIFAINPSKQLADSRDSQREGDVYLLVQALYQYAADNEGAFPASLTTTEQEICITGAVDCTGLADLSSLTDAEAYLTTVPRDPLCSSVPTACGTSGTGYWVNVTTSGRLYVYASSSENKIISVTQ